MAQVQMTAESPRDVFRVHANYIRAIARLAAENHGSRRSALESVATRFAQSFPTVGGQPREVAGVLRSLRHAWSTELLLDVTAASIEDDEFARVANNWVVVQTYYATYHATQALVQAKGYERPTQHPPTLRLFLSLWGGTANPIMPWGLAHGAAGTTGVHSDGKIEVGIHPWTRCTRSTCLSLAALALRTTRDDAVLEALARRRDQVSKEQRRNWNAEEQKRIEAGRRPRKLPRAFRPRLAADEKSRVHSGVRGHTILDYLWRLRVRTNYADSAMFTDGPENPGESEEVRDCLRWVASSTIFINELAIARILGGRWMRSAIEDWLARNGPRDVPLCLRERQEYLADLPG